MKINVNFISLIITSCLFVMILVSCESHEQKGDDAFKQVRENKMLSKDSIITNKIELVNKIEYLDEWTKFKMEMEKKILTNENKIKKIKNNPNANTKLIRQVSSLEKDNNDLRRQMDEYNEEVKVKWENFKVVINHNANLINIELKDLIINNKNL